MPVIGGWSKYSPLIGGWSQYSPVIGPLLQVLTAEICTPTYTTSCGPVSVKGTKLGEREQCVEIR